MINKEKEIEAKNLYIEYKKLKSSTELKVSDFSISGRVEAQKISLSDMLRKEQIRLKLLSEYKPYLKLHPEEWFEIEND